MNTAGSFKCACPPGYTGDPGDSCSDINECGRPMTCGVNAACRNEPGGFACFCPEGFSGDGRVFCES